MSQAYSVSGEIDLAVILTVGSMPDYQDVADRLFQSDPNVLSFQSMFVLQEHKFDLSN